MFALYYEQDNGHLIWIASCQDARSARNVAQIYSTDSAHAVVCIYNDGNGTTRRSCLYKNGQEIFTAYPFAPPGETQGHDRTGSH